MPYVNIKVTKEGVTDLLQNMLGKSPATTVVVVDEIDTDNWGVAGERATIFRRK